MADAEVIEGCRAIGFWLTRPVHARVVDQFLVDRAFIPNRTSTRKSSRLSMTSIRQLRTTSPTLWQLRHCSLRPGVSPSSGPRGLRSFCPAGHPNADVATH